MVFSTNPLTKSFQKIGASIGDARIVLLGEQNHGDGLTIEVKSQLVRYLHEVHDFNVLVFESSFSRLPHPDETNPKAE